MDAEAVLSTYDHRAGRIDLGLSNGACRLESAREDGTFARDAFAYDPEADS
jgi:hypothetical protein